MSSSRRKRASSLALRLSLWYAASMFLILAAASGLLYWALMQSFDQEDARYLAGKVGTLRTLLARNDAHTLKWEVEGEAGERVMSRVFTTDGRLLIETSGMSRELPGGMPRQTGTAKVRAPNERVYRVDTTRARGPRGEPYIAQVALEVTFESNMLAQYRGRLWLVLGVGLIAAMLVGAAIARRGLRPVAEITRTVRRIRSTTLDERLDTAGLPSELSALAATFNETLDRLEDAFARLARFSSDIAHELRTPINNLRGEVEVALARPRSAGEYQDVLASSLEECLRLSRLIDSLLFLARAEDPKAQIRREPVEIDRELAAVREFYEAAANDAGVALASRAPAGLIAELDRGMFQRAIGNLLENALAHTPAGGSIRLEAERANGALSVSVADTGCGIPPEHLPHVFDRFHRVDPARSTDRGGAGLGLAIVKSIAALHGGKAEIASQPAAGTRVTLHLPV